MIASLPAPTGEESPLLPVILLGLGVGVLVFTLMNLLRRRSAARAGQEDGTPKERLASLRDTAAKRDDLNALVVDAEELCRRFAAQLDNKAARLERLLDQADARIARLERLGSGPPGSAGRGIGGRAIDAPDEHADPIASEVYTLSDQGLPPVEIARRLGQQTGKVELILALRQP